MHNPFNPIELTRAALLQQSLAIAVYRTMWWRCLQMWNGSMTDIEYMTMWTEKPAAFAKGFHDAGLAMMRRKSPAAVMRAGLAPINARARSNARRLG